jgi:hypothetical protein
MPITSLRAPEKILLCWLLIGTVQILVFICRSNKDRCCDGLFQTGFRILILENRPRILISSLVVNIAGRLDLPKVTLNDINVLREM